MLTLSNVSVNYGAIEALTGISLHVEQGEVVTLIGANGAGKPPRSVLLLDYWNHDRAP
jgi:branched-chain amino acid transport system ATP-binding protein